MRWFLTLILSTMLAGCGTKPAQMSDFNSRDVTLPGGQVLRVETMIDQRDVMRGMMFRESLAPDRGMLFVHGAQGRYPYWMYQCRIALDMIWMDSDRRIVEIVPSAQPCKTEASKCPEYGGHELAQYVLELGGGMAAKYGLKVGDRLAF
jgi:uncharacterized membrane protein (UPF0127 family)